MQVSNIDASSDAQESPPVRQALFDEFQHIEWQARVEAIRERLDDQRRERQEAERAQEQVAEEQAQEQEDEADRQARQARQRMAISLQWQGDRLLPGEQCDSYLLEFRNDIVIELEGTGAYRYPSDYATAALRNAVDERAGSRATKLLMLSLDRDLAADLQGKNGAYRARMPAAGD